MYADLPKSVIKMERFVLRLRRRYGEVPAPSVLDKIERDRASRERGIRKEIHRKALAMISPTLVEILDAT